MKMLSGLHKLLGEGRFLQQVDRLALQYKGESLPFAELKAGLKALSTTLSKNSELLGTKPDHLATSVWDACKGNIFFDVMGSLHALRHLAADHEEISALLNLPVFANHSVMRAYIGYCIPDTVNACFHRVPAQADSRWQLGFAIGDRGERPVILLHSSANGEGEYDKLEVGQILHVGTIGTLMEQMDELLATVRETLDAYLANPKEWVSPERAARETRKELLTLMASLDAEQKALLKKICLQDPVMLQQVLAAAA